MSIRTVGLVLLLTLVSLCVGTSNTDPKQVHIAFAGSDDEGYPNTLNIAWFTQDDTTGSFVQYGYTLDNMIGSAQGNEPAKQYLIGHGYHHSVQLPTLPKANTRYYYRVGTPDATWSKNFSFVSPSSNTTSFSVSIFGDMGYLGSTERPMKILKDGLFKNWSAVPTRTRLEILKNDEKYDFMWHLGDISYADDGFAHEPVRFTYEDVLNNYMEWMENITASMPFMVTAGNHESECHSPACIADPIYGQSLKNFSSFNYRFHMPSKTSGGVQNMWYSYNYGPVHFINMNSETDWPGAGEEHKGDSGIFKAGHFADDGVYLEWLESDLKKASAERDKRPWIIAGSHRPFPEIDNNSTKLSALFKKYGVDMYFAGHAHSYTRSVPTHNGINDISSVHNNNHYHDTKATTYIVVGGAGCDEMDYIVDKDTLQVSAVKRIKHTADMLPVNSELEDVKTSSYATGILTVHNRSAVSWDLYDSYTGNVLDHLTLSKSS